MIFLRRISNIPGKKRAFLVNKMEGIVLAGSDGRARRYHLKVQLILRGIRCINAASIINCLFLEFRLIISEILAPATDTRVPATTRGNATKNVIHSRFFYTAKFI